ncbi:MAG: TetR/AcrR family transcriptional regulator [Bacteroidota bacterium]|nr:TetR/AcrR family transcriptional regulator [Bacteroidota bacterium]MDP4193397.1 TetR/AcrR family transcriptional regulator [Bacteroidota bacterium]
MNEIICKEREKQILRAARNIFAQYGFAKTTMEDISAEVEMGKASLYYYFPTKESLFESVISQERDEFMEKIGLTLAKENTESQKLRTYVEERIGFFKQLMNLGMLSNHSFLDKSSFQQKLSDEFSDKEMKVIENIIRNGITTGEFQKDINAEELSSVLIHLLQGLRLRVIRKALGKQMDNKLYRELRREMTITIDIFIKGIELKK